MKNNQLIGKTIQYTFTVNLLWEMTHKMQTGQTQTHSQIQQLGQTTAQQKLKVIVCSGSSDYKGDKSDSLLNKEEEMQSSLLSSLLLAHTMAYIGLQNALVKSVCFFIQAKGKSQHPCVNNNPLWQTEGKKPQNKCLQYYDSFGHNHCYDLSCRKSVSLSSHLVCGDDHNACAHSWSSRPSGMLCMREKKSRALCHTTINITPRDPNLTWSAVAAPVAQHLHCSHAKNKNILETISGKKQTKKNNNPTT